LLVWAKMLFYRHFELIQSTYWFTTTWKCIKYMRTWIWQTFLSSFSFASWTSQQTSVPRWVIVRCWCKMDFTKWYVIHYFKNKLWDSKFIQAFDGKNVLGHSRINSLLYRSSIIRFFLWKDVKFIMESEIVIRKGIWL